MLDLTPTDPLLDLLRLNKESGFNYRKRRQDDWTENYTLYRDRVTINRLTQRHSVNLPLMKQTIRTLLKDVDDMPVLYFENLNNDKQAEVFQNEYWKKVLELNKAELKDIMDKRQVFLYGRSFDQWQIVDGMIRWTIIDPEDILVDRYMDPSDIDSSRFLIHTHIFVPLSSLELNKDYDQSKVADLKLWHASDQGLLKSKSNEEMLNKKNEKMADLGLSDVDSPVLGETYIELSMHFIYQKEVLHLVVEADDYNILMNKPLDEVIGKTKDDYWQNHFPYNTWADDIDKQDFWSDGIADIVRTPNKVLNAWFSQLIENRTLRNFNMNLYDSSIEGFVPQTWDAKAWGMYGVPVPPGGRIDDVFKQLPVADLSESLDEMTYVTGMIEKATGATTTQQGSVQEKQITLGEVELALGEAKERIKGMSKFYTPAWKERGTKFLKLIEAASDKLDAVKIHKKGRNTDNIFTREIAPKDWMTELGYTTKVWSQDEKATNDSQALEKLNAAVINIPGNPKLIEVYQRKLLEFAGLTPEEINTIMEVEKQKQELMTQMGTVPLQAPINIPSRLAAPTPKVASKKPSANKETVDKLKIIRSKLK